MAHTKAKGTSKLGRDSRAKRLGVKIFSGQKVKAGQIIIRQRGSKYFPGKGVLQATDDTLYAQKEGVVTFARKRIATFFGRGDVRTVVMVR